MSEKTDLQQLLVEALTQIKDCHLGDCPAAQDELSHALNHIAHLRKMAHDVLVKFKSEKAETEFLALLDKDIKENPQNLIPMTTDMLEKARALTEGVVFDLDQPL